MADITLISSVLGSIKTATDIAKLIKESDISLEKAETKLKLADLISSLADARIEIAEIQNLLLEKDTKIKELEETLNINKMVEWESPYYWLVDGEKKVGPFCQNCKDDKGKMIRLQDYGDGSWGCTVCKNDYVDKNYKGPDSVYFQPERY